MLAVSRWKGRLAGEYYIAVVAAAVVVPHRFHEISRIDAFSTEGTSVSLTDYLQAALLEFCLTPSKSQPLPIHSKFKYCRMLL